MLIVKPRASSVAPCKQNSLGPRLTPNTKPTSRSLSWDQPRPQGLLAFQNGGGSRRRHFEKREDPGDEVVVGRRRLAAGKLGREQKLHPFLAYEAYGTYGPRDWNWNWPIRVQYAGQTEFSYVMRREDPGNEVVACSVEHRICIRLPAMSRQWF